MKILNKCPLCNSDFSWTEWSGKIGTQFKVMCINLDLCFHGSPNNGCQFKCYGKRLKGGQVEFFYDEDEGFEIYYEFSISNYLLKTKNW